MKTTDLIRSAIGNTFRAKLRTTLTVVAIFIGAFTLTLTSSVGTGISSYIDTQVGSLGSTNSMTVTKTESSSSSPGSAPQKYTGASVTSGRQGRTQTALTTTDVDAISKVQNVTSVTKNQTLSTSWVQYSSHDKYVLTMSPTATSASTLAAGSDVDSSSSNEIVLPTSYVDTIGLGDPAEAIGKTVSIGVPDYAGTMHTLQAKVVGIQDDSLFSSGAIGNAALRDSIVATENTGKPASVAQAYGSVTATYASGSSTHTVDAIKSDLKDAGYTGQTTADQLGSINTVIYSIIGVLDAFAVIALIAAGFGIVNTLLMSVQERTREIGLMKAMGMSSSRVFGLFSMEAIFIGFLGSAIGAGIAIALGTAASGLLSRSLLSDLPGLNIMQFTPQSVVAIVLVVMAISFLAGTLPARRAARQSPITALRFE
jgi:putative ABC transport system permease protein